MACRVGIHTAVASYVSAHHTSSSSIHTTYGSPLSLSIAATHKSARNVPVFRTTPAMPPLHSRLLYHARTALLFTLSDLKTILFPIVRPCPAPRVPPLTDASAPAVRLRVRNRPAALRRTHPPRRGMDLGPPAAVQPLEPGARARRGRGQQAVAPAARGARHARAGRAPALGGPRRMFIVFGRARAGAGGRDARADAVAVYVR